MNSKTVNIRTSLPAIVSARKKANPQAIVVNSTLAIEIIKALSDLKLLRNEIQSSTILTVNVTKPIRSTRPIKSGTAPSKSKLPSQT